MSSPSRYGTTVTHLILTICFLLALVGCGGDGSSGGAPSPRETVTGKALLGPLCGATVALFPADDLNNVLYSTVTLNSNDLNTAGTFEIPSDLLQDDIMYVVVVSGGYDMDTDDTADSDETKTQNNGSIRLVASGTQLKQGNFTVNILTELVYNQVVYLLLAHYPFPSVVYEMNRCARLLLARDINGDTTIDHTDLFHWHPVDHKDFLLQGSGSLEPCIAAVHQGECLAGLAKERLSGILTTSGISGDFYGIRIHNHYAYVADADAAGLRIIDMTDPGMLVQVGSVSIPGSAMHVAVSDNYAYVAQWNIIDYKETYSGLQAVDITSPSAPVLAGSVILPSKPYAVAVSENYAYAACGNLGLQVIDISNPDMPGIAGYVDTPGFAWDVVLAGNYAYVADGDSGFRIINISDPFAPVSVAAVETPLASLGIAISGNYAYVICAEDYTGLQVIDITDPIEPVALDYLVCTPGEAVAVAVSGNYAYLVGGNFDPIVIDVTDPTSLKVAGSPSEAFHGPYYRDLDVFGGYVCVVGPLFHLIDASVPTAVATVGTVNISSQAVAVSGNYAYVIGQSLPWGMDGTPPSLLVIDIRDPSIPLLTGRIEVGGDAAIEISNGFAYIAAGDAGVQVADVSDPFEPVLLSTMDTPSEAQDITVSGSYAYVAASDAGLQIIDISNPVTPIIVGALDTFPNAAGVAVSDNYALVSAWDSGLQIIDISDPHAPALVSTVASTSQTMNVSVSGNYAFMADSTSGLRVVDISNPIAPNILGEVKTLVAAWHVALSGDYAYVADYFSGFQIIDVSDLSNPVPMGYVDIPGYSHDLSIAGDYAFIACGIPGLQIFKIVPAS